MLGFHPIADLPIADIPSVLGALVREGGGTLAPLSLPPAPDQYDRQNEQTTRNELKRADQANFKRGQDVRLQQGERFILKSPNGTLYSITITDGGVITATAI